MGRPENLAKLMVAGQMHTFYEARRADHTGNAWRSLEYAHILAQPYFVMHVTSHWHMLCYAIALKDRREVLGQVFRLALVPVGALTGRIPIGNNGRAKVSAFMPMTISDDLKQAMQASSFSTKV